MFPIILMNRQNRRSFRIAGIVRIVGIVRIALLTSCLVQSLAVCSYSFTSTDSSHRQFPSPHAITLLVSATPLPSARCHMWPHSASHRVSLVLRPNLLVEYAVVPNVLEIVD